MVLARTCREALRPRPAVVEVQEQEPIKRKRRFTWLKATKRGRAPNSLDANEQANELAAEEGIWRIVVNPSRAL